NDTVHKYLNPAPQRDLRTNISPLYRQQAFGYTQEDLRILMEPMATTGQEAVGSMGNDTPISALSDKPKLLYTYFKQNFAQVTNPPIDSIREELVMSLVSFIGPPPNLVDLEVCRAASASKCGSRSSPTRIWRRSARSVTWRSSSTPRRSTAPTRPRRARPAWRTRLRACASGPRPPCMAATTSSSCPIA